MIVPRIHFDTRTHSSHGGDCGGGANLDDRDAAHICTFQRTSWLVWCTYRECGTFRVRCLFTLRAFRPENLFGVPIEIGVPVLWALLQVAIPFCNTPQANKHFDFFCSISGTRNALLLSLQCIVETRGDV